MKFEDKVLVQRFFDRFWPEFLGFLFLWNVSIGLGLFILFKIFNGQ